MKTNVRLYMVLDGTYTHTNTHVVDGATGTMKLWCVVCVCVVVVVVVLMMVVVVVVVVGGWRLVIGIVQRECWIYIGSAVRMLRAARRVTKKGVFTKKL